jgi:hypothetical protein
MSDNLFSSGCLWPMWDHSDTPNHEYCGHKRLAGQSYCPKHYEQSVRHSEERADRFVPRKIAA